MKTKKHDIIKNISKVEHFDWWKDVSAISVSMYLGSVIRIDAHLSTEINSKMFNEGWLFNRKIIKMVDVSVRKLEIFSGIYVYNYVLLSCGCCFNYKYFSAF